MNKKAIQLTLTQIIGLVIVILIFFGTIGLVMKITGILTEKPDEATIKSFENLMHEINSIEDGEIKEVPYYIGEGLYLETTCVDELSSNELADDICVCRVNCLRKRVIRDFHAQMFTIDIVGSDEDKIITFDENKEVINLYMVREGERICIGKKEITQC